jgi:glycosyltransferase involved in cell wall biosynthesis
MEPQLRLSIGIPVFNGEKFLEEVLISFKNQTFEDYEIVISDNASVDRTRLICLDYAAKDPRIRYYRNERNLGANPNFNRVFALARAPLFKWAAHDDLYTPTYLEKCIRVLDENPDVVLVHCDCGCIDERGHPFAVKRPPSFIDPRSGQVIKLDPIGLAESANVVRRFWDVLFRMDCNLHIFGVMRRDALTRTALWRDFYGADKLVLAELALLGRFVQVRETLLLKRYHEEMSGFLSKAEQRAFAQSGPTRARRLRQLETYYSAVFGKGLSAANVAACLAMVAMLVPKVMVNTLLGQERRRMAMVAPWRPLRHS